MTLLVRAPARLDSERRGAGGGLGSAAGFTLLELILALVIFTLLVLMVYGAFYVGHRAVIAGERDADMNQRMRLAEDIIGRQIRSAVIYFARHDDEPVPFFFGRAEGMSFVSAAPQGHGGMGLAAITYRVVDGRLVLEERFGFAPADLYDPPADAPVQRAVLLEGFSSLRFEYLPHDEAEAQWQKDWDAREEDALPAAVRLSVDGLAFFASQPWVQEIPLMAVAYGWGTDDFQEPPDDEDTQDDAAGTGVNDDDGDNDDAGDEP